MSFDDHWMPEPNTGCYIWLGPLDKCGYGRYGAKTAYTIMVERAGRIIPKGMTVDHQCRNRWCINDLHLKVCTYWDNLLNSNNICVANSRKTHCKRGHEFTPENTYVQKQPNRRSNWRICKTCVAEYRLTHPRRKSRTYDRARYLAKYIPHPRPASTHCPKGHPYSPENTIIEKKKHSRHCRICGREASRLCMRQKRLIKRGVERATLTV